MAGIVPGAKGNIPLLKEAMSKRLALGEPLKGGDFLMTFEGEDQVSVLVFSAQMPGHKRELIEDRGSFGVNVRFQGNDVRAGEMPITISEVITGASSDFLRAWAENKDYKEVIFTAVSESNNAPISSLTRKFLGCWLDVDPADFSKDDSATPLKISCTMNYNWWDYG